MAAGPRVGGFPACVGWEGVLTPSLLPAAPTLPPSPVALSAPLGHSAAPFSSNTPHAPGFERGTALLMLFCW